MQTAETIKTLHESKKEYVFIELYFPGNENRIGVEFGLKGDSKSYDMQIENILSSMMYRDLADKTIVFKVKPFSGGRLLYEKTRKP